MAILQQLCTFPPLNAFSEHLQIAAQVEHPRKARPQHHIFEWRARSVEQELGIRRLRHRIEKKAESGVRRGRGREEGQKREDLSGRVEQQVAEREKRRRSRTGRRRRRMAMRDNWRRGVAREGKRKRL